MHYLAISDDKPHSLICDHSERIGGGKKGASEIKKHAFFNGVVFEQLRMIEAPFTPKLKSEIDYTYFPVDEIDQHDNSDALRAQALYQSAEAAAEMEMAFINYTFKRFPMSAD